MLESPYDCPECKTTHDYYGDCPTREIRFIIFNCDCGKRYYSEFTDAEGWHFKCQDLACKAYFKKVFRLEDSQILVRGEFRVKRDA